MTSHHQGPASRSTGDRQSPERRCPPAISIIIVTYNTRALVLACLESIRRAAAETSLEVIVVDNGSADGTAAAIRETAPETHLIKSAENLGFGRAANLAAREARADILLFLNSDTRLLPGCLTALLDLFARRPEAGAAGPLLLHADGSRQHSVYRLPSRRALLHTGTLLGRFGLFRGEFRHYQYKDLDPDSEQRVEHVKGAALAIRRSVWEQLGGFDPRFFMYYEDLDLSRRLHDAGHEIWYLPGARVLHAGKRTAAQSWPHAFLASRESLLTYLERCRDRPLSRRARLAIRWLAAADDTAAIPATLAKWILCRLIAPDRAPRHRAALAARLAAFLPTLTGRRARRARLAGTAAPRNESGG